MSLGLSAAAWGMIATTAVSAGSAALNADGTRKAQHSANDAAQAAAGVQDYQSLSNYFSQKGIDIQQIIARHPEYQAEWRRILAAGSESPGETFNSWLYKHLSSTPTDSFWTEVNSGTIGAQNVNLPAWATINGQPAEPALFQQILNLSQNPQQLASQPSVFASPANIAAFLTANPQVRTDLEAMLAESGDTRSVEQWIHDDALTGDSMFTGQLQTLAAAGITSQRSTQPGVSPGIAGLQGLSTDLATRLLNGGLLGDRLAGLQPALDARTNAANLLDNRNTELRAGSTDILNTNLTGIAGVQGASETAATDTYNANVDKLAALLGVRREAAQSIYDATTKGNQDIYGAQLLSADAYGQSAEEAANRAIAKQSANRARQGFTGTSSGADLLKARTLAGALTQGALARTGAGVDLARGNAGAGVGLATTRGQAGEADAMAQLQAAVALAQELGLARVTGATGTAAANDANATRQAGILDSDADIAQQNAAFQNAMDRLNAMLAGQSQQLAGVNLPYELGQNSLNLQTQQADARYADIAALLKMLQGFSTRAVAQPTVTTPAQGSVLNSGQIAGGAITALGSAYSNYNSNQALADAIAKLGKSNTTTAAFAGGSSGGDF